MMTASPVQLRILSLGAGIQSTTMALMAAHGEIEPMPDCSIFADTGWESKNTYEHLAWLRSANVLPFPVHIVANGNIRHMLTTEEKDKFIAIPFFLGDGGMGRRQCTNEFKIRPLSWKMRELLGKGRRDRIAPGTVEVWIGISTDEAHRVKPSRVQWQQNRWPLIEKGINRGDCRAWMKRHGYSEPPKSACIGCPFRSNEMWRKLRDESPEEWADALEVDRRIRTMGTLRNTENAQYMHTDRVPLDEADLRHDGQADLFGNECEGVCGV
jgi:hypothetical protein